VTADLVKFGALVDRYIRETLPERKGTALRLPFVAREPYQAAMARRDAPKGKAVARRGFD
jgi:hypothetical protein